MEAEVEEVEVEEQEEVVEAHREEDGEDSEAEEVVAVSVAPALVEEEGFEEEEGDDPSGDRQLRITDLTLTRPNSRNGTTESGHLTKIVGIWFAAPRGTRRSPAGPLFPTINAKFFFKTQPYPALHSALE